GGERPHVAMATWHVCRNAAGLWRTDLCHTRSSGWALWTTWSIIRVDWCGPSGSLRAPGWLPLLAHSANPSVDATELSAGADSGAGGGCLGCDRGIARPATCGRAANGRAARPEP